MSDFQDRLIAAQGIANEVRSTGQRLVINGNGMVVLHHSTSSKNAESIQSSGMFMGNTWFSASKAATMEQEPTEVTHAAQKAA